MRVIFIVALVVTSSISVYSQTCQSNNFAANQTVVASDGNEMAINVVDGNLTTDWFGGADSKWLYVDLGTSKNLCRVTLKMGLWASIPQTVIQGSNDGSTWTTLYTIQANTQGGHVSNGDYSYDNFDVDLSATTTSYRYVRIYYPSNAAWGPHLKEFEVYIKQTSATPTVSITRPTNGNTYLQGSTLNMAANASEQGGSISKVEFYANNTLLGQSVTSPYTFNWTNIQAGDYAITARAYDASNQVSVSGTVSIHVTIPGWSLNGNNSVGAGSFLGTTDANPLIIKTNNLERLKVTSGGTVAINATSDAHLPSDAALVVDGFVYARKLTVTQNSWADYVFNNNYRLRPLHEVESYISRFHHLPDVPSAANVQSQGIDVGNNQALLLQKIEELTLYIIQLNKEIQTLKQVNQKNCK